MNEEQLKEWIRENLRITAWLDSGRYGGDAVRVALHFKGEQEEISSDFFTLPQKDTP